MPCTLTSIDQSVTCISSNGGIFQSYVTDIANIASMTFTDGAVSAITMATPGQWTKFVYDDDDSAYYNQEGERTNNRHVSNQSAMLKFAGISAANIEAAKELKNCCSLVAIHFLNSGERLIQGIEYDAVADNFKQSRKRCRATLNVMTDTGDNEDRIEVTLESQANVESPTTTLTATDIEAL